MSGSRAQVVIDQALLRDGEDGPSLIGALCVPCGKRAFPYTDTCPWCGTDATRQVSLAPTGTLWGWTAVTAAPPGYSGPVPYGFGVVELDDGLRVITRLTETDPAALSFGQPMRLVLDAVDQNDEGDDIVTWAFAPTDAP